MSGNVWEWTRSLWGKNLYDMEFEYPYRPGGDCEDLSATDEVARVFRGGAFTVGPLIVRYAGRGRNTPTFVGAAVGFRVALLPFSSGL